MKVLITGGHGDLGLALSKVFKNAVSPTRKELDVTSKKLVEKFVLREMPDVLIHAAALVGVRECEENKELAWNTNVEGTQNIVDALTKLGNKCHLVYISTACVFAGEKNKFYTEYDTPAPKNYYSLTKVCGEIVTRQYQNSCTIRTNFVPKKQWKYSKAFCDRFGTYLFAGQVAEGIREVVKNKEAGIIHIAGDKRMSMYELAILAGSKNIGKITLDEYRGPPLTVDMSLSTKRWKKYRIK